VQDRNQVELVADADRNRCAPHLVVNLGEYFKPRFADNPDREIDIGEFRGRFQPGIGIPGQRCDAEIDIEKGILTDRRGHQAPDQAVHAALDQGFTAIKEGRGDIKSNGRRLAPVRGGLPLVIDVEGQLQRRFTGNLVVQPLRKDDPGGQGEAGRRLGDHVDGPNLIGQSDA